MSSHTRAVILEMFRSRPQLAAELLQFLGVPIPPNTVANVWSGDLTATVPLEDEPQPDESAQFNALLAALGTFDAFHADLYLDLVLSTLPAASQHHLEELMETTGFTFQSDHFHRLQRRAVAAAKADDIVTLLEERGIEVPDEIRDRFVECTDLDRLDAWFRRAITADSIRDLNV